MKKLISIGIFIALISVLALNAVAADIFYEGFEDDKWADRGWAVEADKGEPVISTDIKRTGNASMQLIDANPVLQIEAQDSYFNKVIEVWLYDDGVTENSNAVMLLYNVTSAGHLAVGIRDSVSTTHYSSRLGDTNSFVETEVARTPGWHRLVADFSTPGSVKVWIDDQMVREEQDVEWEFTSNRNIDIGNHWSTSEVGFHFDDFRVYEGPYVPGQDSAAAATPETEAPAAVDEAATEAPAAVNEAATEAPAAVDEATPEPEASAPAPVTAPKTADPLVIIIIGLIISASGVVVLKKRGQKN